MIILLVILSFDFALGKWLDYLNLKHMRPELPEEVRDIYDEEKYKKSLAYSRANTRFGFITSTFSFLLAFTLLVTGFFGWYDGLLRTWLEHEILISLVFFASLFLASDLLNIPFQLYDTFVIEERFGFNKTTPGTFVVDKLKGYVLTAVLGGIILYLLLSLIQHFGPVFWLYFWVVISLFILLINVFYTSVIVPIFNKLTPLAPGSLREGIEAYSRSVNFPLTNIFVIDGSKRSGKSNAFFSGMGSRKKVVLYDTLIDNHSEQELIAILAHEVGHYKKRHIISGLIISVLQSGIMLFVMSLMIFSPALSFALGGEQLAFHLNLLAFGILYSPISHILGIFLNMLSRKNEYEADAYALTTYPGPHMETALKKLSVHNLSNLYPHPAYVFLNYSHPPLLKRLSALQRHTWR